MPESNTVQPAAIQPGLCDACGDASGELTLHPGTQWANCPRCKASAARTELIVHGSRSDAMGAIGRADAPTLALAERLCRIAHREAKAAQQPAAGYLQRAQFCRRRSLSIQPDPVPTRHTFRP